MKRRIFIEHSSKLAVLGFLGLQACNDDEISGMLTGSVEIDLTQAPFSALNEPGNWILHPDENILLVNHEGEIRAFTSVCTHSQCARNWVFSPSEATCTCHSSIFDTAGEVVRGPAERSLTRYDVTQSVDSVTVS